MTVNDAWTKEIMERMDNHPRGIARQEDQAQSLSEKIIVKNWATEKRGKRWKNHLDTVSRSKTTPAHDEIMGRKRD